jgi:hypothetical protein
MVDQMVSGGADLSFDSKRWIATASSEPEPAVTKWPRRWRYALVLGTPLLFWAVIFAALHWG